MSLPILSRYVAVSVNCEESYEYSLATGRAKGKAWFQISRQAGTSYRTALWPGGCGGLGDKISCSPTVENIAGWALEPLLSRAANKLAQRYKR